ncbi:hypothetical protein ANCCAN_30497 [Ancylostoma caninum]|uniref:G-protein coupled receptors family 1 profile domain-containing protein n=1 Tax=Ancylostoma caninum TaxID=29170 RepID=A0A368EVX6_ANCCA|nr:hypothetical protein ANCCAN_30497 [Ancylostoma caninum]
MLSVWYNPILRNSFGVLCFSHSIANFGVLLVFVFWLTPVTVIGIIALVVYNYYRQADITTELLGKVLGQINIMFWDVCVYSHLAISINRIVAITLPYKAAELLTIRRTFFMVAIVWWLGFCHIIPYFWSEFYFSIILTRPTKPAHL